MAGEIVTKGSRFYCVSLQPDICKTPNGPSTPAIPYTIKGEFAEATGVSPNITSNQEAVVIHASTVIPTVTGDEKGTAKGVKSKTVGKRVQHDQKSATVSFNGERAIRVGDTVFMNDKNTTGKVYERAAAAAGAPAGAPGGATQEPPRSQAMGDFEGRFNQVFALLADPKSAITNAAITIASGAIAGVPVEESALRSPGNTDLSSRDDDRTHAKGPNLVEQIRTVSALMPSALLNRVPGLAAVGKTVGKVASAAAARPSNSPNKTDSTSRTESNRAVPVATARDRGDGGIVPDHSGKAGGIDGGTSRGRSRDVNPETHGKAPPSAASSGDSSTRTRINVLEEFPDFPAWGARILADNQVTIYRVKDNVVEAFPLLHGRHPTGHPAAATYDQIPGVYLDSENAVAIAPDSERKTGSFNTSYHELAHAIDRFVKFSTSEKFIAAWGNDYDALRLDYYKYRSTGRGEAFAEGFSRYFRGDREMRKNWPHIYQYFMALDKCMASGKAGC